MSTSLKVAYVFPGGCDGYGAYRELMRGWHASAVEDVLCEDVHRPNFELLIADWLAGSLKGRLLDAASHGRLKRQGLFRPDVVGRIVDRFLSGETLFGFSLWSFLVFQEWEVKRRTGAAS